MTLARISELAKAVNGRVAGVDDTSAGFERIETDSRKVRRGDVFWALKGPRNDGHQFIADAHSRGACVCIGEKGLLPRGVPGIAVADTLQALWDFAGWHRQRMDALLIGITGSVGKTTTRHMLQATLAARFAGIESPGNYNNHWGVPLSLLTIRPEHEFAVLEFGASQVGEIARLATLAEPEIGVLTAIGPAHLEQFGTIENICDAKSELLRALPASGFAVINGDDERVRALADRATCRVLRAGTRTNNEVVGRGIEIGSGVLRFQVDRSKFVVHAAGRHFLTSALLSVGVARELGMHDSEIAAGLQTFRPVAGRCQVLTLGPWTVIDDSYNANPASMRAACELLRDWQEANQRVLIAGDMLELGPQSAEFHAGVGLEAVRCGVTRIVALGAQAAQLAGSAKNAGMDAGCLGACRDMDTLNLLLDCWLEPGDVILVKGSRGMHMEQVVEQLRHLAGARKHESKSRRAA
ncbi:MAG: UDP-N-acetylmuramoyl-tripeptide--D-alanyl-D-alanine ligase [Planctomycetaceae bacterium]